MPFPVQVEAALHQVGANGLAGELATERACGGAKFHSPTPLLLHEVPIAPSGEGETVLLCGTCRDNLSVIRHLLHEYDGEIPWAVRREFGNLTRAIALRGWKMDHPDDEVQDG